MDRELFEKIDPCLDDLADSIGKLLEGGQAAKLRELLTQLGQELGKEFSVGLNVVVEVFDLNEERTLPLIQTGIAAPHDREPYRTWGDSSPQRYIVEGNMVIVPDDRCPQCWETWDFKWITPSCSHCGATLGEGVKILLDDDICPYCEKGNISKASPTCDQCGHSVDPSIVVWG
jgi:hypothetical protein